MKSLGKLHIKILIASWLGMAALSSSHAFAQQAGGLAAETAARQAADTAEASARQAADTAEATARKEVDSSLQALITTLQGQVTALQTQVNSIPKPVVHKVGDHYAGGIIFHVTEDGQHGLIAALHDQDDGTGVQWWNNWIQFYADVRYGIGAGATNTSLINSAATTENILAQYALQWAARLAALYHSRDDGLPCSGALTETCYGDWYLPALEELQLLYLQKDIVGGFAAEENYWSSTEYGEPKAWCIRFGSTYGDIIYHDKKDKLRVRAIRRF